MEGLAHLAKLADKGLHCALAHPRCVPVEAWRKVVGQHGVWVHCVHAAGKLAGLVHDGIRGLHPDQVGVRRVLNRAADAALRAALVAVVSLTRPRSVPVPVRHRLEPELLLGDHDSTNPEKEG